MGCVCVCGVVVVVVGVWVGGGGLACTRLTCTRLTRCICHMCASVPLPSNFLQYLLPVQSGKVLLSQQLNSKVSDVGLAR